MPYVIIYGTSFCFISIGVCHGSMIFFFLCIASWRCSCAARVQGGVVGEQFKFHSVDCWESKAQCERY